MAPLTKAATLADVAAYCRVSKSTVSSILSTKYSDNYAQKTRDRVLKASRDLGYVPHRRGRSLRTDKSYMLGLFTAGALRTYSGFGNPGLLALANGVRDALRDSEYEVLMVEPKHSGGGIDALLEATHAKKIDAAVILVDAHMGGHDLGLLRRTGLPLFVLEATRPSSDGLIRSDEQQGMREALSHLRGLGHTRVGYMHAPGSFPARAAAFRAICGELALAGALVPVSGFDPFLYARKAAETIGGRRAPTALVVGRGDMAAIAVIEELDKNGIRVSEDVSVIGWKDLPVAGFAGLTTVRRPFAEIGRRGAAEMLKMLEQPDYTPRPIVLEQHLLVRRTTGPASDAA